MSSHDRVGYEEISLGWCPSSFAYLAQLSPHNVGFPGEDDLFSPLHLRVLSIHIDLQNEEMGGSG